MSYEPSKSLPLFIENRTGSWVLTSLYISSSIHRKQDRQQSISLPLFKENRTGSYVLPSLYISTSLHRKQERQLCLTLLLYLYLSSWKIGQVVMSYPPSISLPLFIENRTGSWVLPSLYIYISIHRKQDRQLGITLPLYLYLYI